MGLQQWESGYIVNVLTSEDISLNKGVFHLVMDFLNRFWNLSKLYGILQNCQKV